MFTHHRGPLLDALLGPPHSIPQQAAGPLPNSLERWLEARGAPMQQNCSEDRQCASPVLNSAAPFRLLCLGNAGNRGPPAAQSEATRRLVSQSCLKCPQAIMQSHRGRPRRYFEAASALAPDSISYVKGIGRLRGVPAQAPMGRGGGTAPGGQPLAGVSMPGDSQEAPIDTTQFQVRTCPPVPRYAFSKTLS